MLPSRVTRHGAAARWLRAAALCCAVLGRGAGAQPADTLAAAEVDTLSRYLTTALVGPSEAASYLVLAEASLALDPTDSVAVYDLVVRYDPERYHAPYNGLYPLTFEDQFIQWGKRIALYSRSIPARTGRYYLHDLSTGQHAWVTTEQARLLYPATSPPWPPPVAVDASTGQQPWLALMHAVETGTPLRQMTLCLRLLQRQSREAVLARAAAGR